MSNFEEDREMFQNSELLCEGLLHFAWISKQTMSNLGCDNGDLEGLVNDLRCTQGVHMSVLLIEKSQLSVKVSLRSNPTIHQADGIDCAKLAQSFSEKGGGHIRAAGASINSDLATAIEQVKKACIRVIQEKLGRDFGA